MITYIDKSVVSRALKLQDDVQIFMHYLRAMSLTNGVNRGRQFTTSAPNIRLSARFIPVIHAFQRSSKILQLYACGRILPTQALLRCEMAIARVYNRISTLSHFLYQDIFLCSLKNLQLFPVLNVKLCNYIFILHVRFLFYLYTADLVHVSVSSR